MKKTLFLSLSVLLAVQLFAGPQGDSRAGASSEKVKMKMYGWGDEARRRVFETIISRSVQNVDMEVTMIPLAELQQKLSIQMAAGEAPDVSMLTERMFPQFLSSNQLADVSDLLNDKAFNYDDFIPSLRNIPIQNGKLYGVPISFGPRVLYFNKQIFRDKGLKNPLELAQEGKWTYDEMRRLAKAVTDPSRGIYGLALFQQNNYKDWSTATYDLVWAFGADYFDKDMTRVTINTPQGKQALQYFYDLLFVDESHIKPGDQTTFETGKIAMARDVFSYSVKLRQIGLDFDIAPSPRGPAASPVVSGMTVLSAPLTSRKNDQLVIDIIKAIATTETGKEWAVTVPFPRNSFLSSDAFLNAASPPTASGIKTAFVDPANAGIRLVPSNKNFEKLDTQMRIIFDIMYTKSETIDQIIKRMETDLNPILKE